MTLPSRQAFLLLRLLFVMQAYQRFAFLFLVLREMERRLLYVGGTKLSTGENGLYVISLYDLPRPGEAALGVFGSKILDENLDLQDDRILGFIPNAGGCSAANDDVTVAYSANGGVQIIDLGLGANTMFVDCNSPCTFHEVQQNLVYADAKVNSFRRAPLKTLTDLSKLADQEPTHYQILYQFNSGKTALGQFEETSPRDLDASLMTTNKYQAGTLSGREYAQGQLKLKANGKSIEAPAEAIIYNYHEYDFNQILTDEEYTTSPADLATQEGVETWLSTAAYGKPSVFARRGVGEISAGATAVLVDGGDSVNAVLPASGVIRIDREEIEYSGKTVLDGYKPALIATRRGANGTSAVAHNSGNLNADVYLKTEVVGLSADGRFLFVGNSLGAREKGQIEIDGYVVDYISRTDNGFLLGVPMQSAPQAGTGIYYRIAKAGTLASRIIVEEARKVPDQPVSTAVILTHLQKERGLVRLREGAIDEDDLDRRLNDAMGVVGGAGTLLDELVRGIKTARDRFYDKTGAHSWETFLNNTEGQGITGIDPQCKECNFRYAEPEGSANTEFTLTDAQRKLQRKGGEAGFKAVVNRHPVKFRIMNRATWALFKYTPHVTVFNIKVLGTRGGNSLFAKVWKDLGFGQ